MAYAIRNDFGWTIMHSAVRTTGRRWIVGFPCRRWLSLNPTCGDVRRGSGISIMRSICQRRRLCLRKWCTRRHVPGRILEHVDHPSVRTRSGLRVYDNVYNKMELHENCWDMSATQ